MHKPKVELLDYHEYLITKLQQDPKLAIGYLNEASKDEDPRMFYVALKNVFEAHGHDMTALAKKANISRQSLHRILSGKGQPNGCKPTVNGKTHQLPTQPTPNTSKPSK